MPSKSKWVTTLYYLPVQIYHVRREFLTRCAFLLFLTSLSGTTVHRLAESRRLGVVLYFFFSLFLLPFISNLSTRNIYGLWLRKWFWICPRLFLLLSLLPQQGWSFLFLEQFSCRYSHGSSWSGLKIAFRRRPSLIARCYCEPYSHHIFHVLYALCLFFILISMSFIF